MKKVGKTTRPFRYDLNQICYDYTVESILVNRFKRLDLKDRVPEELWMEVCDIVQESVIKNVPKKKKHKKAKWLSEEALQIAKKRREAIGKEEKEIYPSECRVPKNSKRHKKVFLSDQCKEIKESNKMGKTRISSRKLEIPREHFMQRSIQ